MNRDKYIHHVLEQKRNMTIDTIDYKHILEKGNKLFAFYYPRGKNIYDLPVEAEVIAYFSVSNTIEFYARFLFIFLLLQDKKDIQRQGFVIRGRDLSKSDATSPQSIIQEPY